MASQVRSLSYISLLGAGELGNAAFVQQVYKGLMAELQGSAHDLRRSIMQAAKTSPAERDASPARLRLLGANVVNLFWMLCRHAGAALKSHNVRFCHYPVLPGMRMPMRSCKQALSSDVPRVITSCQVPHSP